jgi:MYXO-CTERM domain-containing protein
MTPKHVAALALLVFGAVGCQEPAAPSVQRAVGALRATPGGVDVRTFGVDNARTGWNRRETALTPANVRPETFGLVATTRGVTAGDVQGQPLFLSDHLVRDEARGAEVRADTVFTATMEDRVYALDADDLHAFWRFDFEGRHFAWADDLQRCQSHFPIGVMSTPVISADGALLYVVGRVQGARPTDTWLQGYALRTRDGTVSARFRVGETVAADGTRTPLVVDGFDRGAPVRVSFATQQYTQRSALLLVGNTLYVSTGGICDTPGFRGWMLAFDVTRLSEATAPAAVLMPNPAGGGGMWAVGGAAADARSLFIPVGNARAAQRVGTPAAQRAFGDALLRTDFALTLDRTACFTVASPTAACGPGDASNFRNFFMPRNAELLAREGIEDMDPAGDVGDPDEDFGSTGPLLVPAAELASNRGVDDGRPVLAVAGKDGFVFLLERDRLGGIGPSRLATPDDVPRLVGAELWGREVFQHSTSGGIRSNMAYFEGRSGRYLYAIGADEIGGRADSARGLAALRLTTAADPTAAECAAQYRRTAYNNTALGCATIWGAQRRPAFDLAWSGSGPLLGGSVFVSSSGYDQGVVWMTVETNPDDPDRRGLLVAFAADQGAGTGRVFAPIYRSDRVEADQNPSGAATFGGPIVANGRVYVPGGLGLAAYGPIAARALPVMPSPPPPPDCAADATWEALGQPFMTTYCVGCHEEYRDLGFVRRRAGRVAESILPTGGGTPSMPLQRDGMPVPSPDGAARSRVAAWLRCGAPAETTRVHAGYEDLAAPGGAFLGDPAVIDPALPGRLSDDLLGGAGLANGYTPEVPDGVFRMQRGGPARWSIPVPGSGRYAVSLYFAENTCLSGAAACRAPFDVSVQGTRVLSGFDVVAAAGGARRVVGRGHAVTLGAGSRLRVEVSDGGRLNAIEVRRVGSCPAAACPRMFECVAGACAPAAMTSPGFDGGVAPDAGAALDAGATDVARTDAQTVDAGRADAGRLDGGGAAVDANGAAADAGFLVGTLPGCSCRVGAPPTRSIDARWWLLLALVAYRRRRAGSRT